MNGVQKSSTVILFNLKLWRSFTTDFYGCCDVWFYHGFSRNFTLKLCIYDASGGPRQTGQASLIGHQLGDQLYDAENKIDAIASNTWYSRSSHYVGCHDTEGVAKRNPRYRATPHNAKNANIKYLKRWYLFYFSASYNWSPSWCPIRDAWPVWHGPLEASCIHNFKVKFRENPW